MFENRHDAAQKLATHVQKIELPKDTIVYGLPRGGVPLAHHIAQKLNLPLAIIIARKLRAPDNRELAIGAITSDGIPYLHTNLIEQLSINQTYLDAEIATQKQEINTRKKLFKQAGNIPIPTTSCALIIDDGIATGATMIAAVEHLKRAGARKVIVAVPVAPQDTIALLESYADQVIVLDSPDYFPAVGAFYRSFPPVEDTEVIRLLQS